MNHHKCADVLDNIFVGAPDDRANDALVFAATELRKMTWQPMATAPKDVEAFFWIVPKSADEAWLDTSGKPITVDHRPYRHLGLFGSWGALSKAVLWMSLPDPPTPEAHG